VAVDKVQSGSRLRIKARDWNQIAGVVNAATSDLAPGGGPLTFPRTGVIVPIRNGTGGDLDPFSILGIAGPGIHPGTDLAGFQRERMLEGATPSEPGHVGRFAILLEPAADGAIAAGLIAGPCPVLLDVASTAEASFADIRDGDTTHLTTGPTGAAYVLWRAGGTGTQWGLVMLGPPAWPEKVNGDAYMIRQLRDIGGGVIRPVWDWARMHNPT
jgi:hypothetical protein